MIIAVASSQTVNVCFKAWNENSKTSKFILYNQKVYQPSDRRKRGAHIKGGQYSPEYCPPVRRLLSELHPSGCR